METAVLLALISVVLFLAAIVWQMQAWGKSKKLPTFVPKPLPLLANPSVAALRGKVVVVTGGNGFLGRRVVREVLRYGVQKVRAVDITAGKPDSEWPQSKVELIVADIVNYDDCARFLKGADVLIHTAALFGKPLFCSRCCPWQCGPRVFAVNHQGSKNLVEAAAKAGLRAMVHISSVAAMTSMATLPVANCDESIKVPDDHPDYYGASKALGEREVLANNGNNALHTAVLRPNGIYGWGDRFIFPRVLKISYWLFGGIYFYVNKQSLTDYTCVDNLANGAILAAGNLLSSDKPVAGGRVYNITDGIAINTFDFMQRVLEACGHLYVPVLRLPLFIVLPILQALERFLCFVMPSGRVEPPFCTIEMLKLHYTHYYSIARARREIGYEPISPEECMAETARYFAAQREFHYESSTRRAAVAALFGVITAVCALITMA